MFFLNNTPARKRFKEILGQANHFIITILIGLNGIEIGSIERDPEFHAIWNPQDRAASARRSRAFALDLALVRGVDAIDTYMNWSVRSPAVVQDREFKSATDKAGRSVWMKLRAFSSYVASDPTLNDLTFLAIAWRNRRVHSLAENTIPSESRARIKGKEEEIARTFRGLNVGLLLRHLDNNENPTFKEAAGIISVIQKLAEGLDLELIRNLDLVTYLRQNIINELSNGYEDRTQTNLTRERFVLLRAQKVWDRDEKQKSTRVENLLRVLGFSGVDSLGLNKCLPSDIVQKIMQFSAKEVLEFARS